MTPLHEIISKSGIPISLLLQHAVALVVSQNCEPQPSCVPPYMAISPLIFVAMKLFFSL